MVLKNSLIMKAAIKLVLLTSLFLFPVQAEAQNKNSVQGDFEALMALYNSTQGYGVETLSSKSNLPSPSNASYPYMYIINNEIWALSKERQRGIGEWVNHGAIWKDKTGWTNMTPSTMGNAVGVEIYSNGRVIKLDLQKITTAPRNSGTVTTGNGVIGVLPPEIGNLSKMEWFNIKQNFFHGEIPDVFGNWTNLERFSIGGQTWEMNLDRRIEWHESDHVRVNYNNDPFTHSTVAKQILATNNFRTQLPTSLGSLPKLELIEAAHQYLIGSLPASWGNLPAIRGIYLPDIRGPQSVTLGEIPESWGNMKTMTLFTLGQYHTHRRFSGQLPDGMRHWSNLANFGIGPNNFSGPFPQFENFNDLVYFTIGSNDFTGKFPWTSIFNGNNSRLSKFVISFNNFSGSLPQTIPAPTQPAVSYSKYNLADFSIHNNSFEGDLPGWVADFRELQIINISNNNFTGPFPVKLLDQHRLKTVYLQGNNLSGQLPDGKWSTDRIRWFQIQGNDFEGEIPDSWQTLFQKSDGSWNDATFQSYLFHDNNFSGRVPDWGKNVSWGSHQGYTFDGNRYTFKDIGDVYDDLKAHFGSNWRIDKQRPFGDSQTRTMPAGEELVIDLSEFDYTGNKYRWLKNGAPLSGETSPVLTISKLDSGDEGEYRLEVTNSRMTELGTHISRPITVKIGNDDGQNDGNSSDGDGSGGNDDDSKPDAPKNISPGNSSGNVSATPRFEWSSTGADSYIINVRRTGSSQNVIYTEVNGTIYTPSDSLQYETTYRWRVRSVEDGEQSAWSSEWTFTTGVDPDGGGDDGNGDNDDDNTETLAAPGQISPHNNAADVPNSITFEWSDVDADEYILHITRENGHGSQEEFFYSDREGAVITDNTYTVAKPTEAEREHHWRVRAVKNGEKGAWSPIWRFTTGEKEMQETLFEIELSQNYPNPFNPTTQIRFMISESQQVSLKVYDMAGRLVANLVDNSSYSAGSHEVTFNANSLASGIYFYRFITESEIVTRKMTLMK